MTKAARIWICIGVVVGGSVVLSGCGDDDPSLPSVSREAEAAYQGSGPYPVGSMTLELADRKVAVFYPAAPGSEVGQPRAHYRQTDPLREPLLKNFAENQARRRGIDLDFEMRAFGNLPAASGKFPVLLFSHGFGGWRLVNSSLLAGIASWGFVIASPDHLERDLNAVSTNSAQPNLAKDGEVLLGSLDLLVQENARAEGPLHGRIDTNAVAVAGHSAGGAAALSLIDAPAIKAIIGYASVGSVSTPPSKPTMLIIADGDIAVTPESTRVIFDALRAPKRMVTITQTGHNSFTDLCDSIRSGASLTQLARDAGLAIDERLLALAENGCAAADLSPDAVWSITQHFTVAQLRHVFGIDPRPVGLGAAVAGAFVVPVLYDDIRS